MDKMMTIPNNMKSYKKGKSEKSWEKRENFDDGGFKEIRVREVSNGFIKCVTTSTKKGEEWVYDKVETIHTENPMEERSLADKLETFLKDN